MKCATCGHDGGRHVEYERIYAEPCGVKGCECKNFVAPSKPTASAPGSGGAIPSGRQRP